MHILQMGKEEILKLTVRNALRLLAPEELLHIATTLGAFWAYDYGAADQGRFGMHALLKSGNHSDGFFVSKILLEPENIMRIMADQMATRIENAKVPNPDFVVGVPDGATTLGSAIARTLGLREAQMEKVEGRILLRTKIPRGATILLIEDFCTRGTGFTEAVLQVKNKQPSAKFVPYDPVIINRGGLSSFSVDRVGVFTILPVANLRIQDWEPANCPLCARGSKAIKPKATDENWQLITTLQRF